MRKLLILALVWFGLCCHVTSGGHGHSHDGGHGHAHDEPPSFKWSKQANQPEDEIIEDDIDIGNIETITGHGHAHVHGEAHGHSHGGHDHGHSHGGQKQRELNPEERAKMRKNLHAKWDDDEESQPTRGNANVWFQALGATLLISAAPFFILFFIPLDNSAEKQWLLKILLSFASGGLLGDAFLHLIPHAQMAVGSGDEHGHSHSHGHSHDHGEEGHAHDMSVGLGVLFGIISFLCVEKFVRIVKGGHGHSHSSQPVKSTPAQTKEKKEESKAKKSKSSDSEEEKKEKKDAKDDESKEKKKKEASQGDSKKEKKVDENDGEIAVAGYLNLAADCFHNFTDGLAIGASYLAGESIGLITTFTILLHEVPHEIGDFAILIQSGVPKTKAIFLQLLTAVGAMTGCCVSLLLDGITETATSITLPFTAGGFIYIATVSVLPELLEGSTFKQSVMEIIALLLGVLMMVFIAQYE